MLCLLFSSSGDQRSSGFDISHNIHFVPVLHQQDIYTYFVLFEHVADTLKWPKEVWSLLLQSLLTGEAQEVYTSIPMEHGLCYDHTKSCILRVVVIF